MMKTLLTASLVLAITGCTVNGHDEFTCPNPEEGICMSSEDAMKHAEAGRDAESIRRHSKSSTSKKDNVDTRHGEVAPVVGLMSEYISQPKPVLEPAKVLLAWVNVWEDEDAVLHMPQEAYVEITNRRWNISDTKVEKYKSASPFKKVANSEN